MTYEAVFRAMPCAAVLSRVDTGEVVDANDAYVGLVGSDRDAIVGRAPAGDAPTNMENEADVAFGAKMFHRSQRTIELDGVAHVLATYADVTDDRRNKVEHDSTAKHMREFAANVHEAFWLTDPLNTKVFYISPAYERLFGRSAATLDTDARDWLNALHADDRARMLHVILNPSSATVCHEFRIVKPDGGIRYIRAKLFPVQDSDGDLIRMGGLAEDVTRTRELGEQVREAQKMESLGLLAGGVAHDFNNILAVVHCNASMLADDLGNNHPDRELVDEIGQAVHRAESLTRQLLAFSRKQVVVPDSIELNAVVNETRKMLRRMVGDDITLTISLEPELGRILIDPGCLVQVLMNLAVNARDAMDTGGNLAITTRSADTGGKREVIVAVSDTGCGMPEAVRARVFEPFFTTKGLGKGTGLGLSVVHGIVEQAGGRIEIESEVGVGTTFRIIFPLSEGAAPIDHVALSATCGTETLLVVDDDAHVRRSLSRTLRAFGYNVLETSDGTEALRLIAEHAGAISLMLTDVVMPEMDGRQLADKALILQPGLRVVFMSGYTDDAVLRHGVERGEEAVLEKPFSGDKLSIWIRKSLDVQPRCPSLARARVDTTTMSIGQAVA